MMLLKMMLAYFIKPKHKSSPIDKAIAEGINDTFIQMGYQLKDKPNT